MKQRSQSGTTTGLQETELTRGAWATWRPLLLIALALRLVLTALPPYTIDMSGYIAWSRHLASIGPTGLYEQFHVVYAPLFHYCLWLTGECIEAFHLNFFMHGYAIKLWSVAADLIGAMLLLRYAARVGRAHAGMPFALLYLLNPAVVFNASVWGQFDGIPAVMMLGVMLLFRSQKPVPAAWLFVAAVLVKPQSGLLAPLVLLLFLRATLSRPWKRALACWFAAFLGGIAIYLVVVLPFYEPTALAATLPRWVDPFWWLFDLYLRSVQDYPFGTANAWNLWYVLGAQTLPDSGVFLGLSHAGWGLTLLAPFAVWSLWLAGRAAAPAQKSTARDIPAPAQKSTARDIPTSALESTARDIPAPETRRRPFWRAKPCGRLAAAVCGVPVHDQNARALSGARAPDGVCGRADPPPAAGTAAGRLPPLVSEHALALSHQFLGSLLAATESPAQSHRLGRHGAGLCVDLCDSHDKG